MTKCQLRKNFEQINKCRFLPIELQYQNILFWKMELYFTFFFFLTQYLYCLNRRFQSIVSFLMLHKEQTTFTFQGIHTLKSLLTSKTCHCFSLGSSEAEWKGRGATGTTLWILTVIFGKETESAPSTSYRKVLRFQRNNSSLKCYANSSDCCRRPLCCLENN